MPSTFRHTLAAAAITSLAWVGSAQAAAVVATYDFNNTLAPVTGTADALVEVDPTNSSGFITDTVNGTTRTVWRFDGNAAPAASQGGLQFTSGDLLTSNSYSVELYFRFDQVSGWRRILDTADRSSDVGFYVLSGGLQLYPSNVGVGTFMANTYYHVLLTYSGTQAVAYLNGSAQSTQNTSYYDLPASDVISLFLDNTQSVAQNEYSAGAIAWARFYDGVLSANEAAAAYRSAIAFDPGTPNPTPIPGTAALALLGLAVAAGLHRRNRQQ
jgi:MYXO-CTERM domain-containing protein